MKYSRVYFNNLTEKISAMGNGTVSIEELYLYCDDVIKYTTSFQERTTEITDESAGDYKAANNMYIWNICQIARDLQMYINKNDMKALSSAQDGIQLSSYYESEVLKARKAYLVSAGYTDSEAEQIITDSENDDT